MKRIIAIAAASTFLLTGCAATTERYQMYVTGQAQIEAARYSAQAEKYRAMAAIASGGSETSKVAAVIAMISGNEATAGGSGAAQLQAPRDEAQSVLQWAAVLVPALVTGYSIYSTTKLGIANSDNAAATARSTNEAFVAMAGQIQAPVVPAPVLPQANVTTTNTTTTNLSGAGVIGSGTYAPQNNPVLSGTGVIGDGTFTPAPVVVTPVVPNSTVVPIVPAVTNPTVVTPTNPAVVPIVVAPPGSAVVGPTAP